MKKMAAFISMFCIFNLLVLIGLFGFMMGTGRLDKTKLQAISDLVRHNGTPKDLREKVDDFWKPVAASQPATASAPASQPSTPENDLGLPATAEERIDFLQKRLEEGRLQMENEAQDLQHRQELLEQKQAQLELDQKKLAEDKKVFDAQVAAAKTGVNDAGFDKAMSFFDGLKPKQVKDLLSGMQVSDAAKFIGAMEPDRAAKVMAEFKSPAEKQFLGDLVDQVRGAHGNTGTGAATAPSAAVNASPEPAGLAAARARPGP